MIAPDRFVFLNQAGDLDHGWDCPHATKLWRYHLHYFDDLIAEAAETRRAWHVGIIRKWIEENAPGEGTGWEPYPTSLRIVNWVKSCWSGLEPSDRMLSSLAIQIRWLYGRVEGHLLGNHLLANAKALLYGGCFFQGEEARQWRHRGRMLLRRETARQILPDGGHFERSPMYHGVVLEDLLDLVHLERVYDLQLGLELREPIRALLRFYDLLSHPDGDIAFFNDACLNAAAPPTELHAYARRLGLKPCVHDVGGAVTRLDASGFARFERSGAVALMDVGSLGPDYLPGHAHAGTLSLECSLDGARVLVNSGTSVYASGPERLRQRGTSAHNTLVIDGCNSSEVWEAFRVARRARTGVRGEPDQAPAEAITAWHDGFRRLRGKPRHQRRVALAADRLEVLDEVLGQYHHRCEGYWHLHPRIRPHVDASAMTVELEGPTGAVARVDIAGADALVAEPTTWHAQFGRSEPAWRLVFRKEGVLPLRIRTVLSWKRPGPAPATGPGPGPINDG